MFLIDKYRPDSLDNIFFHKDLIQLLNVMSQDEAVPHIIFYGPEGAGKKTTINLFLEMLFDKSIHDVKETNYKVMGSGNKPTIEKIKQSNYHIVIDPKNNNYDRYLIHDVVKDYARRRSLNVFKTNRTFKLILINNLDNMSYYAQTSLRRTMERYNDKCRFIMWCRSLSKVISPLQSRCVCLRVSCPTDNEMFEYVYKISVMEKIYLSLNQYCSIVKKANGNIKNALWRLEFLRFGCDIENTNYKNSISKIVKLLTEAKIENISDIRNTFFSLTITNFDGTTMLRDIIDKICLNDNLSEDTIQKIIKIGSEVQHQMVKGRREIIQFDAFITSCIQLLWQEKG